MQQLPDEFNGASSERDEYESMTDMEPINAGERDSASRYSTKGNMPTSLVIAAAVLLSVVINASLMFVTSDRPFSHLASSFGFKSKQPAQDALQQIAIDQLNDIVARHVNEIAQLNTSIKSLGEFVSDLKSSIVENDSKITRLEARVEEAVNEINKFKIQRVTPKPVAVVKPKEPPKPQIFVSLVSIRSQGGSQWVTLRDGLDTSPLMAVGDEWRSVKLISTDINNKSAQIAVNGAVSVVRL